MSGFPSGILLWRTVAGPSVLLVADDERCVVFRGSSGDGPGGAALAVGLRYGVRQRQGGASARQAIMKARLSGHPPCCGDVDPAPGDVREDGFFWPPLLLLAGIGSG